MPTTAEFSQSNVCAFGAGHTELCHITSYMEGAKLEDARDGNDECLYGRLGTEDDIYDADIRWYPMRIWHSSTKKAFTIRQILHRKGFNTYLRLEYSEQIKNQELVEVAKPVFSNLIFVQTRKNIMRLLKNTDPSLRSLQFMTKVKRDTNERSVIISVPDRDMMNFIAAETRDDPYRQRQYWAYDDKLAKPGRKVRILRGPFAGITGEIKNYKTHRVVIVKLANLGLANAITRIPKKDLIFIDEKSMEE